MKNHLSMLGSIGAGAKFSFSGIAGLWSGLIRLGDCLTVRLVLSSISRVQNRGTCHSRGNTARIDLAGDQSLPSLRTLTDDIGGVPVFN